MQTKKEEIRDTILKAAQKEFLIHGYEGASMRVIARKANTTLGNIYHYFRNKEDILASLLEEPVKNLKMLEDIHLQRQHIEYSVKEVEDALREIDNVEGLKELGEFRYIMDRRLLILFDLRTTRYADFKNEFIKKCKQHLAWHMKMKDSDSPYIDILVETFVSCMRHVLLEHEDVETAQKEFLKVFKMLCIGLVVHKEEE